ncbi:universal stress protein [Roseivivax sp. CAU 1761]
MFRGTLTVLLTDVEIDGHALRLAREVVREEGGHLDVCCLGIEAREPSYANGDAVLVAHPDARSAYRGAFELAEKLRSRLPTERPHLTIKSVRVPPGELENEVTRLTRFADCVVSPAPFDRRRRERVIPLAVIDAALNVSRLPVLVSPDGANGFAGFEQITIAWDGSTAAMAAVRAALPFLWGTVRAEVLIVGNPVERADGSDLIRYLGRHGVSAFLTVLPSGDKPVSEIIKHHAARNGCRLLVMGAYGHSKLLEAVFGGTTRDLLHSVPAPLLLAH